MHSPGPSLGGEYHFSLKERGLLAGMTDSRAKEVQDKRGTSSGTRK